MRLATLALLLASQAAAAPIACLDPQVQAGVADRLRQEAVAASHPDMRAQVLARLPRTAIGLTATRTMLTLGNAATCQAVLSVVLPADAARMIDASNTDIWFRHMPMRLSPAGWGGPIVFRAQRSDDGRSLWLEVQDQGLLATAIAYSLAAPPPPRPTPPPQPAPVVQAPPPPAVKPGPCAGLDTATPEGDRACAQRELDAAERELAQAWAEYLSVETGRGRERSIADQQRWEAERAATCDAAPDPLRCRASAAKRRAFILRHNL